MPLDTKNILEAIKEAKDKSEKRKFVQSIELIMSLRDIDPKKPEGKFKNASNCHIPQEKKAKYV